MEDQIFIQYRFTMTNEDGINFSDALVLPLDAYNALNPDQIESLKQERFNNWNTAIHTAVQKIDIPVEDQVAAIDDQITQLTQQKESLITSDPLLQTEITDVSA